ncbi:MAG: hypothetical protein BWZ10_00678 [candidate division BRC1 bacterium ADurb.BinA364]|nr:MAG: hypothetical protein BWZ10_00678 [candidate division BRC1 bacterium ADurb.BinA364]
MAENVVSGEEGAIEEFLNCAVFAVAGVSSNPEKFGARVYRDLLAAGKRVYGINPRLKQLDGETIYAGIEDLPETPDVLTLVVPAKIGLELARAARARGVRRVWMQPGAESEELLAFCRDAGIQTVHDQCVMIRLRR